MRLLRTIRPIDALVGSVSMAVLLAVGSVPPAHADEEAQTSRAKLRIYFKGLKLYESQCLPCHGARGRGDGPWSEGLDPKPRDFRSGLFKFRSTAYGMLPTDDDLRRTILSGISGTAMPTFETMDEAEVGALVAYIKRLSGSWKNKGLHGEPLDIPKTPEWFADPAKVAKRALEGGKAFAETCASCHGIDGKGDGPAAKGLVDFQKNPIQPADLRQEHHKCGDSPADLYRTIATGMNGTPMPGFADSMSETAIWDLVAFIEWQGRDPAVDGKSSSEGENPGP